MDDIKSRIRTFLKETGMSRDVFAGLCGVRKNQVNKWLSSSPIPEPRRQLIERVMEEEYRQRRKSPHNPNMYILEVPFPTEDFKTSSKHWYFNTFIKNQLSGNYRVTIFDFANHLFLVFSAICSNSRMMTPTPSQPSPERARTRKIAAAKVTCPLPPAKSTRGTITASTKQTMPTPRNAPAIWELDDSSCLKDFLSTGVIGDGTTGPCIFLSFPFLINSHAVEKNNQVCVPSRQIFVLSSISPRDFISNNSSPLKGPLVSPLSRTKKFIGVTYQ